MARARATARSELYPPPAAEAAPGSGIVIDGGPADDVLSGGLGADVLFGAGGDDLLFGGGGRDRLEARVGNDTLDGGPGSDVYVLHGRRGDSLVVADAGGADDTLDFSGGRGGARIDLGPGETSSVDGRTVTVSGASDLALPLDFVLAQDLSGSFGDDLPTVEDLAPRLFNAIRRFQDDSLFAVTSFVDKPTSPFGGADDVEYETNLALAERRGAFVRAIEDLELGSGGDFAESQLTALLQIAVRPDEIGFRADSRKIVVLTTDAPFHAAGDFADARGNDGDAVLDGDPPGTGEDYPSVAQVRTALEEAGIVPIFAVTAGVTAEYEALVSDLGIGAVVDLSADSSDIVRAIREGLREVSAADIENAIGTDGDDRMLGNALDNRLEGGRGGDVLRGREGADRLDGGDDDDRLFGEAGADQLFGGLGRDRLVGDGGRDTLEGGAGIDRLFGGAEADRLLGGAGDDRMAGGSGGDVFAVGEDHGRDRIIDFDPDEGDLIDLSALGIGFEDLAIAGRGGGRHTEIETGEGTLFLVRASPEAIDPGDFLF